MRPYRGLTKDGKWVKGWYLEMPDPKLEVKDLSGGAFTVEKKNAITSQSCIAYLPEKGDGLKFSIVIPSTVGQSTGLNGIYAGDYCVMDCWNGGDGIEEPSIHDKFEGIVVYDQKICRWGLQTKLCDKGQIEVGLEDSRYTTIEITGNIHQNPELLENKQ